VDDRVLAIRLVPSGVNVDAQFTGLDDCAQLGVALVCKAVAYTDGVFFDFQKFLSSPLPTGTRRAKPTMAIKIKPRCDNASCMIKG
jgi:hypothetical protein